MALFIFDILMLLLIILIVSVLKVFEFNYTDNSKLSLNHWTASDALSRALVYKLHDIEILVLAWTFKRTFHKLDLPTRETLIEGVKEVSINMIGK
jgi:hypothetical protein